MASGHQRGQQQGFLDQRRCEDEEHTLNILPKLDRKPIALDSQPKPRPSTPNPKPPTVDPEPKHEALHTKSQKPLTRSF